MLSFFLALSALIFLYSVNVMVLSCLGTDKGSSAFTLLTLLEGLGLVVDLEYVFWGVNLMSPKMSASSPNRLGCVVLTLLQLLSLLPLLLLSGFLCLLGVYSVLLA